MGLRAASLLVCGLFVAEDATVVAVRTRIGGAGAARLLGDLVLATVMVGYNFATSRYVVSVSSAARIVQALETVDTERAQRIDAIRNSVARGGRRAIAHLNPFELVKALGHRLGRAVDRAREAARHRRLRRTAALLEDLAVVNVLGVPGAGLALSTNGRKVSAGHSLRHSTLFVASWFVGARVIELVVGRVQRVPYLGPPAAATTRAIGETFAALTDVTRPIGAITLAVVAVAIARYAGQVERTARSAPLRAGH